MTGALYGKPVIATSLPGFSDVLRHEHSALLVPYGDTQALASAILRLAGDAEMRQRLGTRLLADLERNIPGWPEIAARTGECYREALFPAARAAEQPATT
jgi:glycosyltransferase involved in cell wall biosynthesis